MLKYMVEWLDLNLQTSAVGPVFNTQQARWTAHQWIATFDNAN